MPVAIAVVIIAVIFSIIILGFASWTAYRTVTVESEPMRDEEAERLELVEHLSGDGLSTRAVAPIVGTSQRTIADQVNGAAHLPQLEQITVQGVDDGQAITRLVA